LAPVRDRLLQLGRLKGEPDEGDGGLPGYWPTPRRSISPCAALMG